MTQLIPKIAKNIHQMSDAIEAVKKKVSFRFKLPIPQLLFLFSYSVQYYNLAQKPSFFYPTTTNTV